MSSFKDIVDKNIKDEGGYVFQRIRLYNRGDSDIILIVESAAATKGIKFDMTVELTEGEAVSLAGAILSTVEKNKRQEVTP